jgi:hypothetical protein
MKIQNRGKTLGVARTPQKIRHSEKSRLAMFPPFSAVSLNEMTRCEKLGKRKGEGESQRRRRQWTVRTGRDLRAGEKHEDPDEEEEQRSSLVDRAGLIRVPVEADGVVEAEEHDDGGEGVPEELNYKGRCQGSAKLSKDKEQSWTNR